jgi:Cof subfamily protein (haloacid dehalogenase superfamily)
MKQLVFVDSDGTLKNSKGEITENTKRVVNELANKEVDVIITTGRPRYHALKVQSNANASRYLISSNGSEVYDISTGEVIYARYMTPSSVIDVTSIANKNGCRCAFTVNEFEYVQDEAMNVNQRLLEEDLEKFLQTHKVKQIFIRGDSENSINNTYMDIIKLNDVKVVNESSYFHTGVIEKKGLWFSIGHADVNKGTAIIKLCQHLGVDLLNTYGFGNDYNDIEMFSVVNHSIIMENADEELKKYATIITESNDEEGVAILLEKLFLKGR